MYDVVGGGFHRYSTRENWLIPHFEKMLYDNALLAHVYLNAYLQTGNISFRRVCQETLAFLQKEMLDPCGGFYSSLDADCEGQEGLSYLWTVSEVEKVIEDPSDLSLFVQAFPFEIHGNFEGKTILQQTNSDTSLAEGTGKTEEQIRIRLRACLSRLYNARAKRPRPATDDKVLVSWNALAMSAFAAAARHFNNPGYLQIARNNADFILKNMFSDTTLMRSWRQGKLGRQDAFLEDYASLALSLISLYQSDPDPRWYQAAIHLVTRIISDFSDPAGGFFDARDETLLYRPKELQDNAIPCANAMAAMALLTTSFLNGNGDWHSIAEKLLEEVQETAIQVPLGYASWLKGIDFALGPVNQAALLWTEGDSSHLDLLSSIWSTYKPRLVVASSTSPPSNLAPEILQNRPLKDNRPTFYFCEGATCQTAGTTLDELHQQLDAAF
jgi:hypothetical protein